MLHPAFTLPLLLVWSLLAAPLVAEEIQDVIFDTDFDPHSAATKYHFTYNGQPIGEGHAGFQKLVERIGKLPAGTSIVWEPNYDRHTHFRGR